MTVINKVSILPLNYQGIIIPDEDLPVAPFIKKLVFVRNLPTTSDLIVNFSLSPANTLATYTLYGVEEFDDGSGTLTIPENSTFKVIYIGTPQQEEFVIKLLPGENYDFLISNNLSSLTISEKHSAPPIYSVLRSSDPGNFVPLSYSSKGDIGIGVYGGISNTLDISPSVASNPVSIKIDGSHLVTAWIDAYSKKLFLKKSSATNLLPVSALVSYLPSDLDEELSEIFNLSGTKLEGGKFLISFNNSYLQIFNSDLTLYQETYNIIAPLEESCEFPEPFSCNVEINSFCVKVFRYTWYGCNFSDFPLLNVSNGLLFKYTWANCESLTDFPLLDTSNGVIFSFTWAYCYNLSNFPLLNVSKGVDFSNCWEYCLSLTSFPQLDVSSGVIFERTWHDCNNLVSFPSLDVRKGNNFNYTWGNCTSLESFPELDMSSGVCFNSTWSACGSLTSFPNIDVSSGVSFDSTWYGCSNLTTFPNLDVSSGINFEDAWYNCNSLTTFPPLNVSSGVNFRESWLNCESLITFPELDVSSGTNFFGAWSSCSSLTEFPALDFSNGINFEFAWNSCSSLTVFPPINVNQGTNFAGTWANCTGLTSFPILDVSQGTNFESAWANCTSLTIFPELDVSSGLDFFQAWQGCSGLIIFPSLNVNSGVDFTATWENCTSLTTFPAGMFDNCLATIFNEAWFNCALTEESVNNILVSLDIAGQEDGMVNLDGGTSFPPGGVGITAKNNLIFKGWSVFTNT